MIMHYFNSLLPFIVGGITAFVLTRWANRKASQ